MVGVFARSEFDAVSRWIVKAPFREHSLLRFTALKKQRTTGNHALRGLRLSLAVASWQIVAESYGTQRVPSAMSHEVKTAGEPPQDLDQFQLLTKLFGTGPRASRDVKKEPLSSAMRLCPDESMAGWQVEAVGALSGESLGTVTLPPDGSLRELRRLIANLPGVSATVKLFSDGVELQGQSSLADSGVRDGCEVQVISVRSLQMLSGSQDGMARLWELEERSEVERFQHSAELNGVAASPEPGIFASGCSDRSISLWRFGSTETSCQLQGHMGQVYSVDFCPAGSALLSASGDATARLWDLASEQELLCLRGHMRDVNSAAVSPDGRVFATGSDDYSFAVWDRASGKMTQHWDGRRGDGHSGRVYSVASPDGFYLATGAVDKKAKVWDTRTGTCLRCYSGHTDLVNAVTFSPDGKLLASASDDFTSHVWTADTSQGRIASYKHDAEVLTLSFSGNGQTLATGSMTGAICLWDLSSHQEVGESAACGVPKLQLLPGGCRTLAVGEGDFAFSEGLSASRSCTGSAPELVVTCLESEEDIRSQYADADQRLARLRGAGAKVICGVDATELLKGPLVDEEPFERIVFNFPLLPAKVHKPRASSADVQIANRAMLVEFLRGAAAFLRKDGLLLIANKVRPGIPARREMPPCLWAGDSKLAASTSGLDEALAGEDMVPWVDTLLSEVETHGWPVEHDHFDIAERIAGALRCPGRLVEGGPASYSTRSGALSTSPDKVYCHRFYGTPTDSAFGSVAYPDAVRLVGAVETSYVRLRRDFARCWAQRRRSATVKTKPSFGHGLDEAITAVLSVCDTSFVQYYGDWKESFGGSVSSSVRRQRDLFPLPALQSWPLDDTDCLTETALAIANLCLASLNVLASDMDPGKAGHGRSTPTVAQQGVHEHVCNRCQLFLRRLRDSGDESFAWRGSFRFFEEKPHAKYPAMKAEAVDLPSAAATCDAVKLLPADLADMIMDPKQLFPAGSQTESWPMGVMGRDRDEYIKLVLRQLQCGKTALRQRCLAVGDVFCVPKSSPGKQREVWNGALVSQAAARPPQPFKLANPGCFVDLCFAEWEEIYMSKRDVHTCFDVLKAPEHLQPWFGRPPVTLHEMSRVCKVSCSSLARYVADDVAGLTPLLPLYPTSTVWPMGFSWSSCVAQACTVACCLKAGVQEQDFISMDSPPPSGPEICGVATDDTFFFHKDKLVGERRLHQLDAAFDLSGMPKNATKDVTLQQSMTALGCELTSKPPAAEPSAPKLVTLFMALLDVFCVGEASPAGLNRLLGLEQWFCLLSRPMYSIFDSIYEFVRKEPQDRVQPLPSKVRVELVVAAFLAPLLGADLGRRFLPRLIACDASGSFGFGVSYMKCSSSLVKEVSQFSERRGDFVRFFPEEGAVPCRDRIGVPHVLPFHQWQFRTAISARAQWKAHPGVLEAHALHLALKWTLRRPSHFHRRLVILVDAKAVLGAVSKGRTSAPGLRRVLRQIGSLLLATDSLARLVYIPSEDNPADKPSRGTGNFVTSALLSSVCFNQLLA
ncbi:unnamed protein product, partial [Symbiodinium sp. KB8]